MPKIKIEIAIGNHNGKKIQNQFQSIVFVNFKIKKTIKVIKPIVPNESDKLPLELLFLFILFFSYNF